MVRPQESQLTGPGAARRTALQAIAGAAIRSAIPSTIVRQAARRLDLGVGGRTLLLSVGKAAPGMAVAFLEAHPGIVHDGLVIGSHLSNPLPAPLRWQQADHPVPGAQSLAAGRAAIDLARAVGATDTLIVLVSGGASALMTVPVPGVTLEDKQQVTRRLLAAGADIRALNTVRKHLSAIKGGRLAAACEGRVIAWLLSDVVGDDPAVIGSGPTVGDHSTFHEALAILDRYGGRGSFPRSVVAHVERGAAGQEEETPKPGSTVFERATTTVIGSARLSLDGAARAARDMGYSVITRVEPVIGEARLAAADHLRWVASMLQADKGQMCLLSCGETTVTVTGTGKGGRNQEFVLASISALANRPRAITLASVGTDGIDGPTDAAGALADETSLERAEALGMSVGAALEANDAWTFFSSLGDLIVTGPTGTNVGDIQIVLAGSR